MASRPADPARLATALKHFEADQFAEARDVCRKILTSHPDDFWALRLLGVVLTKQKEYEQAAQYLRAALAAGTSDETTAMSTMVDLATALAAQREFGAALEWCQLALTRRPDDVTALHNCANALVALNRHGEALAQYRRARAIDPESVQLEFNEGLALLALGDWRAGWMQYESRLSMPDFFHLDDHPHALPRWRGDTDIRGKTLLLQAEQGLGDTLQFIRYAPLLTECGARVVVRVQPPLGKLLVDLPNVYRVTTFFDEPNAVDMQCLMMSLPAIFGTTLETVPAQVPYLRVPPGFLMLWQALLGPPKRKRVGIAWSGRQHIPLRSMPIAKLAPLLTRSDLEFHSLQKEIPDEDRVWLAANPVVVDHSTELKDFADTAALTSLMDLVITIDTSVAHLAGALALPTWILLSFSADSRWLIDRRDTPWYPTARLFRQKRLKDWDDVVREVLLALP